ncbi:MAG: S9 family peptidase [Streptosporangiaceae bacterium]|jgi:dipeptidyl aminopeptidase/acylaminoacyl peptidase
MADYTEFLPGQRLERSLSISADGTRVAYISDASGQYNLHVQPVAGGAACQLTDFTGRSVREVAWAPDGAAIAFTADVGGDEECQVYLIPASGGQPVSLSTASGQRYLAEKTAFDSAQQYVAYSGAGCSGVVACDLAARAEAVFAGPPGKHTFATAISPDGSWVLAGSIGSNTDCQCYIAHIKTSGGVLEPVTANLPGEYYYPCAWTADGSGFYVRTTDADGEHVSLGLFSLASQGLTIVDSPPWDVEDVVVSADGRTVIWSVNEEGYSRLRGRRDGSDLPVPPIPDGVIDAMSLSHDGSVLALLLDTPHGPPTVVTVFPGTDRPYHYLTDTRSSSVQAIGPELIRYPAADGTLVPAWLYRPAGPGPHPVLVSVHGGPELQARPRYGALHQCLLASGVAVLAPNIRGSGGYGRGWQQRIYRDWGGIDLDDLGAAHAWLVAQSWCTPDKVAVYGASYGGFVALSCLTRLPELWTAGVSVYGPANLLTLATSMPASWAGTIAAMFGDPADPRDAEQLRRRSPVAYVGQIKAPLLVIQGANDPRTPQAESDQIIAAARANGADPDYLLFDDEGHGFTSRDNDIKANIAITTFLTKHLLV